MKRLRQNCYVVLIASLLIGLGSWGAIHGSWDELLAPKSIFELVGLIGSILLAWIGKSPLDGNAKE